MEVVFEFEHRGVSGAVVRSPDPADGAARPEIGDFYCCVTEWGLMSGASFRTADHARRFAMAAVGRVLDGDQTPAAAMRVSGSDALPLSGDLVRLLRSEVDTGDGVCGVFYNAVAEDPQDDPYLDKVGWYYQSEKYDDGPRGPYATRGEAADAAVEHYRPVVAPGAPHG